MTHSEKCNDLMFCEEITNIDSINLQESNGVNLLEDLGNETLKREFGFCRKCDTFFHDDLLPDDIETTRQDDRMEEYCERCADRWREADRIEKQSRFEDTTLSPADRCK